MYLNLSASMQFPLLARTNLSATGAVVRALLPTV
jgi:hypothetical protein